MAVRTIPWIVLLIAAALLGGCGGDPNNPEPTSTSEEPTAETTPRPEPIPTSPLTGVPELDTIIEALRASDRNAIRDLIQFTTFPCATHSSSQPSYPPLCPTGVADGSPIERFISGSCEFSPISPEGIDHLVDRMIGKRVYGVYDSTVVGEFQTQTHVAIVFLPEGTEYDTSSVGIDHGRIVSYVSACGPQTPREMADSFDLGSPIAAR